MASDDKKTIPAPKNGAVEKKADDPKSKDFKIEASGTTGTGEEIRGFIKAADWNEYKIVAKGLR